MDIFESLENLNISEECFNDIMDIVEEIISERDAFTRPRAAKNSIEGRTKKYNDSYDKYYNTVKQDANDQNIPKTDVNTTDVIDGKVHHVYGYDEDDNRHREYVPASSKVQKEFNNMLKARDRLSHAKNIAKISVGDAFRAEEEHQKKTKK